MRRSTSYAVQAAPGGLDKLDVNHTDFFFRVIQPQRYHNIVSHKLHFTNRTD